MKRILVGLAVSAALVLAGCGGDEAGSGSTSGSSGTSSSSGSSGSSGTTGSGSTSGSSGSSGSSGTTGPWTLYDHAPFPIVPNVSGGPTLHHVQLVPITYDGYQYRNQIESFSDWLVTSDWLSQVGADYAVQTGEVYQKVHLADSPPATISDSQVQTYLTSLIDNGTLPVPAGATLPSSGADAGPLDSDAGLADADGGQLDADGGVVDTDGGQLDADGGAAATDGGVVDPLTEPLYAIYYPETTTITFDGNQGTSCQDFGGYHSYFNYRGVNVSYAVLPTCPTPGGTLSYVQVASSHETIEAATDPFPATDFNQNTTSYSFEDFSSPWSLVPGEVGDLCVGTEYQDASGYWVQRSWSNTAAAAGTGSPCIPAPNYVYLNVSPDQTDLVAAYPGDTVTINLTGWSDREYHSKWNLILALYQATFYPDFRLATAAGEATSDNYGSVSIGDHETATLTITIPANTPESRFDPQFAMFMLMSETGNGNYNFWPVGVYVQ